MSIAEVRQTAEHKMQQSVESFKSNLAKVRTGRPNPQLLDTVTCGLLRIHVSRCRKWPTSPCSTPARSVWRLGKRAVGAKIEKRHPRIRPGPEPFQPG